MSSTMKWIRRNYNVPARHGMQITYKGQPATIAGTSGSGLKLRIPGQRRLVYTHPTWAITYPTMPLPKVPRGWCRWCLRECALRNDTSVVRHNRPGAHNFPVNERMCPGAGDKPLAVCSWTVPAPTPAEGAAAASEQEEEVPAA